MSGDVRSSVTLGAALLDRRDFRQALRTRDFGMAFRLLRQHQGTTQAQIAAATGLTQGRVSKLMSDLQMRVMHIDVIERIADGLQIPGAMVGLAARSWEIGDLERDESQQGEDHVLRRTALRAGGALLMGGLVEALDSEPDAMNTALDTSNISTDRLDYFEATAERLGVEVIQVVPTQILTTTVSHFSQRASTGSGTAEDRAPGSAGANRRAVRHRGRRDSLQSGFIRAGNNVV